MEKAPDQSQSSPKQMEGSETANFENIRTSEDFLNSVDFVTLNEIYNSILGKSNAVSKKGFVRHTLSRDKITFVSHLNAIGSLISRGRSDVRSGEIELVDEISSENSSSKVAMKTFQILVHEATHVIAGQTLEGAEPDSLGNNRILQTGFQVTRYQAGINSDHEESYGASLNEAVTENVAQEVLKEYLKRKGLTSLVITEDSSRDLEGNTYVADRQALALVIDALSEEFEVPSEVIWKGIVKAYLEANDGFKIFLTTIQDLIRSNSPSAVYAHRITLGKESIETEFAKSKLHAQGDPTSIEEHENLQAHINELRKAFTALSSNQKLVLKNALGLS